jgi:hypothetical protein
MVKARDAIFVRRAQRVLFTNASQRVFSHSISVSLSLCSARGFPEFSERDTQAPRYQEVRMNGMETGCDSAAESKRRLSLLQSWS